MKQTWVLASLLVLGLVLGLGCNVRAQARTQPPKRPSNVQAPADPLRAAGPALFVSLPEIRARIRSSTHKMVLLHMWASWCPPCIVELPLMGELAASLPARGFELLSVSMDEATRKNAVLVGRVIDGRAAGALTRAIARFEDVDAFVAGLDPQWEGSIPALLAYSRSGDLIGALYGEASRAEIDRFLFDLQPQVGKSK